MKVLKCAVLTCVVLGSAIAGSSTASATINYLTNASFEAGDLSGWTWTGNNGTTYVYPTTSGYGAQDGSYYLFEGPVGSDGILSQTFSDTPGQTLTISGWVAGNGTAPSDVNFLFNGVSHVAINPVPYQPWTQYTFNVTATGTDTFAVSFRNDPSYNGLDNFKVASAPEPSTYMLMGIGGLLAAVRLRKSRLLSAFST